MMLSKRCVELPWALDSTLSMPVPRGRKPGQIKKEVIAIGINSKISMAVLKSYKKQYYGQSCKPGAVI